jgi:hypothetical protein
MEKFTIRLSMMILTILIAGAGKDALNGNVRIFMGYGKTAAPLRYLNKVFE